LQTIVCYDIVDTSEVGDFKSLQEGVFELRLMFGSGCRVYFAEDGKEVILLLIGGDKSSQKNDIQTAKEYWKEYQDNGQKA